jgi:hypothetical protein
MDCSSSTHCVSSSSQPPTQSVHRRLLCGRIVTSCLSSHKTTPNPLWTKSRYHDFTERSHKYCAPTFIKRCKHRSSSWCRYLSITTQTRYILWDTHIQRSIGEIAKEGYVFVDHRVTAVSETTGLTRFIIACCPRRHGSETGEVTFSIFRITYPSLDSQLPASVDELTSRSIQIEYNTLYLDDRIAAISGPGQSDADMQLIVAVDARNFQDVSRVLRNHSEFELFFYLYVPVRQRPPSISPQVQIPRLILVQFERLVG